ncbi:uncharacterized protein LOC116346683 [Contarinia nasturtii]|uniref:uncharacterized protein LOC116346683 n=1 Tax=Contarinia nasturtii TaxID=265458 RepID=UPI0012D4B304|nr:uncharacterized protein LOC116346683 [Contarinia nasturtii]
MPSKLCVDDVARNIIWKITNLSNLKRSESPEFVLRGFHWKFEVRKVLSVDNANALKVFLYRVNMDNGIDVPCIVYAEIKLIPFDNDVEPHQKVIIPNECGGENPSSLSLSLISLNDINDPARKFIQNDTITLEIYIKADAPQLVFPTDLTRLQILRKSQFNIQLNLIVKNLDKRVAGIMSPMFYVADQFWKICAYRNGDALGLYLKPMCFDSQMDSGFYDVTTTISLHPFDAVRHDFIGRIDERTKLLPFNDFIKWTDLFDPSNQYVKNGSFALDIDIELMKIEETVSQIDHTETNENDLGCPICLESFRDLLALEVQAVSLKCGHCYCDDCMKQSVRGRKKCPICNAKVVNTQIRTIYFPYTSR